jgi:hypothetical protein
MEKYLLTVAEYLEKVEPILEEVFNESIFNFPDEITNPFNDSIEDYVFLHSSSNNPFWEQSQFWVALKAAVLELNDMVIYQTDTIQETCYAYGIDKEWTLNLYKATVSLSGKWGLHRDSSSIAFLGGTHSFMNKVRSLYPELDNELANYLRDFTTEDPTDRPLDKPWQDRYTDQPWLPKLLIQFYGEERGKELLEQAKRVGMYYDPDENN